MIIRRSKKDYGDAEIVDRWSTFPVAEPPLVQSLKISKALSKKIFWLRPWTFRGIYPDPTREEYNLIDAFLDKFAWELDDFDESLQRWVSHKNRLQCPNLLDLLRKFIRQVHATKGCDVDFRFDFTGFPFPILIPRSLDDKKFYDEAMAAAKFAIQEINSSTMQLGKTHELMSVDKMVWTSRGIVRPIKMLLLTFTVKKIIAIANVGSDINAKRIVSATNVDSNAVVKTIQAMIQLCDQPPSCFILKEWKYKPFLME